MFKKIIESMAEGKEILLIVSFALGALMMFYGVFECKELKDPDSWSIRNSPKELLVTIGIALSFLSALIIYLTREKPRQKVPDIYGYWHYFVTDSQNMPSHTGKCLIAKDGEMPKFKGIRCYVAEHRNGKFGVVRKNWPWETTWTHYGSDGWFRCEYTFKSFNGYFKIHFDSPESSENEFDGLYYLLPDSFEDGKPPPNAMYGTIKYIRVTKKKYDDVIPPKGLEIWPS